MYEQECDRVNALCKELSEKYVEHKQFFDDVVLLINRLTGKEPPKPRKTDKEKYLEHWGYTPGTPEAEEKWQRKLEMHNIKPQAAQVISDITPYISQIDGSVISSRSKHKQHLKEHGCIEVGNESMEPRKTSWIENKSNKEALRREIAARLDSIS